MQIMTSDAMVVVSRETLRAAELANPDLEMMKWLFDLGKVDANEYWAALKREIEALP